MKVIFTAIACLFFCLTTQAQTKMEQQVQAIQERFADAKQMAENNGKDGHPDKVMDITLQDEGGYGGNIKDVLHIYFYEDQTYAEDGAMQINNKPYMIIRECSRNHLTIEELYLFEINNSGEMREDPLIFAYSKETRDGEELEKAYFWSDGELIHAKVEQGRLVEDREMKEKGDFYYQAFSYLFADISTHCY